ncbi:MAG: hypothetical protein GW808_03100 [Sphingomonadales bacterium]|nr:hypothetical protein [Sphingomonadales bacterium]NCO49891.1 hypothetical protein [Sphingomonadales bacterium]NCP00956.1 hypothetical protein [Sphingomonadales bacterium]NCP27986.1 hypothetical protein [Sphingomonadales bacterium]NCP42918.1 hypothetical protein [Sphingomonadales bacterium]
MAHIRSKGKPFTRLLRAAAALALAGLVTQGCSGEPEASKEEAVTALPTENITEASFGCISDLTAVDRFFVGNLNGDLDATVAVASAEEGGVYPVGSVVQLVPTEVMVKREAGFNAVTKDWEYFDLDISAEGTKILTRGADEVKNRFGNSCQDCHVKAAPQFDLICKTDHGCDPIPINDVMIRGLQKTDPRCEAQPLTAEEADGLKQLQAALGA